VTTHLQAVEEHESAQAEDGAGTLLMVACSAVVGALLWVLIVMAVRWVLELPPLFVGTGIVFGALVHMEITITPTPDRSRERRPVGAAARRGALQRPADALPPGAAHVAPTAPPSAGGRALHLGQGRR
jgi:hypothetical protein